MTKSKLRIGLIAVSGLAAVLPIFATAGTAYADYAPSSTDVVGVGSDTLQYLINFMADGDAYGFTGYNALGNKNKLVSFDATADANARSAYAVDGGNGSTINGVGGYCTPGTGSKAGTANGAPYTGGTPCVLNPTVVLRAGTEPVQRPNGSGGGFTAIENDITAGTDNINFVRASSALGTSTATSYKLDSVEVATDTLPIIEASSGSNAVPLSSGELNNIYNATTTTTNAYGGAGCVKWNQLPGNSAGSSDYIIPIIPQVNSGTRKFFLQQIQGTTGTPANPGNCAVVGEENDPTAIANQAGIIEPMGETGTASDAIEPMSQGRLDLYQGITGAGTNEGFGYFLDPSCPYETTAASCSSGGFVNSVAPAVKDLSGTPGTGLLFDPIRPLYVYFRDSDLSSTTTFQPGTSLNWVHALFYNPCGIGESGCTTVGGVTYGPGGAPYIDGAGATGLTDAGVTAVNTESTFTQYGP
jgi:hypothetical protein